MNLSPKERPDHHDAELVLRAYELRQDPVLRAARQALVLDWWPAAYDEVRAVAAADHPLNAPFRQVTSYWEMIYGMGEHGIVNAEYLVDASGGEAFLILAKFHPWLAECRRDFGPRFLRHVEWAATETDTGRQVFARVLTRVEQRRSGSK
jgi:hypothetical protein